MTGDNLPDQDHIARYCKPSTLLENGMPSGTSFMLKPDEPFLSVNWMEYFGNDLEKNTQIDEIRLHIELSLSKNGLFAVLNIGDLKIALKNKSPDQRILAVSHQPTPNDPSHSGISGYRFEDDMVADLIAEEVGETYPAIEI